jgi:hypothetical protein
VGGSTLVGVNGFYDTSKLYGRWYSSGGIGVEMAANGPGNSAIDLDFNYYGNIFSSEGLRNAFRNLGGSYDIEAGYSQPLFNEAFDLRIKFAGYQFNIGEAVYGWRTGADLTTRNGLFTIRYEHGHDKVNSSYNTIGAFANMGFELDNILKGESPFTMPEPIFASPRNLWWLLTGKVKRNWHQPVAVVLTRTGQPPPSPGCARFLTSVAMPPHPTVPNVYDSGVVPFPPIPYTSLDPTKFIAVEFDHAFTGTPPAVVNWIVFVMAATPAQRNATQTNKPTSDPHLTFLLNGFGIPFSNQSAFTSTARNPQALRFLVQFASGTSAVDVTNVCIRINQ